ncbi:unnamed protein product [Urochloa humidicola]
MPKGCSSSGEKTRRRRRYRIKQQLTRRSRSSLRLGSSSYNSETSRSCCLFVTSWAQAAKQGQIEETIFGVVAIVALPMRKGHLLADGRDVAAFSSSADNGEMSLV